MTIETSAPIRPSQVHFSTYDYELTYGHTPRGRGSWAFCPSRVYCKGNYLDHCFWTPGCTTYQEAKKLARAHFAALGIACVTVCT